MCPHLEASPHCTVRKGKNALAIRWKPLSIIVAAFSVLLLSLFFISRIILLGSFARMENEDTQKNVQRVLNALSDNLAFIKPRGNRLCGMG
jgi:sensor domain CHASE-containing protein